MPVKQVIEILGKDIASVQRYKNDKLYARLEFELYKKGCAIDHVENDLSYFLFKTIVEKKIVLKNNR